MWLYTDQWFSTVVFCVYLEWKRFPAHLQCLHFRYSCWIQISDYYEFGQISNYYNSFKLIVSILFIGISYIILKIN